MDSEKKQLNRIGSFGKIVSANPYDGRRGLVYARVSSKRQEIEGSGLQSQEGRCKDDLRSIGVHYEKSFFDSYTGGGDFMKRPAMRNLLAYIDANPHKKFLVEFDDLKRFARDVEFHLKLRTAFRVRDVLIKCLNYNFDESPEGKFAEIVMAGQAELERHQNQRQVVQKMKARLEAGYWCVGGVKRGYKMIKDPLHGKLAVPNDAEAQTLKEALEGFSKGIFVRKIDACKFLVEKKFWVKQSPEKYIDKFTNIVKDCFYAGLIEYPKWNVERREGKHQGIISVDTFELNRKRLNKEDFNKRIRLDISPDFPVRGLLTCDHCGGHYTAAWSKGRNKKYGYYFCQNKLCSYHGKSVSKEEIESKFIQIIKKNRLKLSVEKLIKAVFDRIWNEEINRLQKSESLKYQQKGKLTEKIKQLTEVMLRAKAETLKSAYENQIEEAAKEIEIIEEQSTEKIDWSIPYRTALNKATGLLRDPYFVWKQLKLEEQHRLFYFIFEQKLPYNQLEGYRTDKITTKMRLFEEFLDENSPDVDPPGIEPGLPPCHGGVMPIYYGPSSYFVYYILFNLNSRKKPVWMISFIC